MSTAAIAVTILLVSPPQAPQAPPAVEPGTTVQSESATTEASVPPDFRAALALMKQPGFHPELLELLDIDRSTAGAPAAPAPAAMKTGYTIAIVAAVVVVLVLLIRSLQSYSGAS